MNTHRILSQEKDGQIAYKVQYRKRIPFLLLSYWTDYKWTNIDNSARVFNTLDAAKAFLYDKKRMEDSQKEYKELEHYRKTQPWKVVKENKSNESKN